MKIQTLSLVVDAPCNATCPYCISRMTGKFKEEDVKSSGFDERNFDKAVMAAKIGGATTALITSKGEPTLNSEQITRYVRKAAPHFPFIELQTNGLVFMEADFETEMTLRGWREDGLTALAISVVSHDDAINKANFAPNHPYWLGRLVGLARKAGLMVRLTCTMFRGGVESWGEMSPLIDYCVRNKIEQLSLGVVAAPWPVENKATYDWVRLRSFSEEDVRVIHEEIGDFGIKLMTLPHGATIYDVRGVSVCVRECLTLNENSDEVRQLIFFPSGRLMYDWRYKGAVLL